MSDAFESLGGGFNNPQYDVLFPEFTSGLGLPTGGYVVGQDLSGQPIYVPYEGDGATNVPLANVQPGSAPGTAVSGTGQSYPGPTLTQMLVGVGALTAITLLLPPRYALWFPVVILAGYAALHPATIQNFFTNLSSTVRGATGV